MIDGIKYVGLLVCWFDLLICRFAGLLCEEKTNGKRKRPLKKE